MAAHGYLAVVGSGGSFAFSSAFSFSRLGNASIDRRRSGDVEHGEADVLCEELLASHAVTNGCARVGGCTRTGSRRCGPFSGWRGAYPYGAVKVIRRGALKGQRIVVSPSMGATYVWGAQDWSWVDREIKPGWTVYDIGANCGQSTLHIAKAVGPRGRVVAFEPVPQNFAALQRNVELSSLQHVTPVCAAAGDRDGMAVFSWSADSPTAGRIEPGGNTSSKVVRLDRRQWRAPNLMKIDVEGGGPE